VLLTVSAPRGIIAPTCYRGCAVARLVIGLVFVLALMLPATAQAQDCRGSADIIFAGGPLYDCVPGYRNSDTSYRHTYNPWSGYQGYYTTGLFAGLDRQMDYWTWYRWCYQSWYRC
jgi:hypothetical protein